MMAPFTKWSRNKIWVVENPGLDFTSAKAAVQTWIHLSFPMLMPFFSDNHSIRVYLCVHYSTWYKIISIDPSCNRGPTHTRKNQREDLTWWREKICTLFLSCGKTQKGENFLVCPKQSVENGIRNSKSRYSDFSEKCSTRHTVKTL